MDRVETWEAKPPSRVFGNLKAFAAMGAILPAASLCVFGFAMAWHPAEAFSD